MNAPFSISIRRIRPTEPAVADGLPRDLAAATDSHPLALDGDLDLLLTDTGEIETEVD